MESKNADGKCFVGAAKDDECGKAVSNKRDKKGKKKKGQADEDDMYNFAKPPANDVKEPGAAFVFVPLIYEQFTCNIEYSTE